MRRKHERAAAGRGRTSAETCSRSATCRPPTRCGDRSSTGSGPRGRIGAAPSTASRSTCDAARCSAWSASRARARRRWGGRCSASSRRRRARSGSRARRSPVAASAELRPLRRRLQIVFQDPHASLNPAMTIGASVARPAALPQAGQRPRGASRARSPRRWSGSGSRRPTEFLDKYPADLSGGQKQRAVLARAIILDPDVLVADEPVSMLDMSVRAKILELMLDLKDELDLTYVYITHDLATAKFFCDRIAIMYLGQIVELGPAEEIYDDPQPPYTAALLRAIPEPDPRRDRPPRPAARRGPRRRRPAARLLLPSPLPEGVRGLRLGVARPADAARGSLDAALPGRLRGASGPVIGDLDGLDVPSVDAILPAPDGGTASSRRRCSQAMRADAPDDPFWSGVAATEVTDARASGSASRSRACRAISASGARPSAATSTIPRRSPRPRRSAADAKGTRTSGRGSRRPGPSSRRAPVPLRRR